MQNHLGGLEALRPMEAKADKVFVKLLDVKADERRNGGGWRLVKTNRKDKRVASQ